MVGVPEVLCHGPDGQDRSMSRKATSKVAGTQGEPAAQGDPGDGLSPNEGEGNMNPYKLKAVSEEELEEATSELRAVLEAASWRLRPVMRRYRSLGAGTQRVDKAVAAALYELIHEGDA